MVGEFSIIWASNITCNSLAIIASLTVMKFAVFLALCSAVTSTDLPKDLSDPVLFCEGCYGTMYEIDRMMINFKHLRLEQRVNKSLAEVCHTDNLRKYVFSPPKMSKVSQSNR